MTSRGLSACALGTFFDQSANLACMLATFFDKCKSSMYTSNFLRSKCKRLVQGYLDTPLWSANFLACLFHKFRNPCSNCDVYSAFNRALMSCQSLSMLCLSLSESHLVVWNRIWDYANGVLLMFTIAYLNLCVLLLFLCVLICVLVANWYRRTVNELWSFTCKSHFGSNYCDFLCH